MSRASRPAGRAAMALVAALATAADAQERPVFPADVELATLDVTVLDSNGQPVALAKVGGRGRMRSRSLSLTEALSFVEREESSLWQAAVERECPGGRELCISDLQSQAHDVVSEHRYKSEGSFAMLAAIFKQLEPVAARKVMVLVSQGLSLPDAGTIARPTPRLRELATAAARARRSTCCASAAARARARTSTPRATSRTTAHATSRASRPWPGWPTAPSCAARPSPPSSAWRGRSRDTTWSASSLPRRTGPAPRATCASPPTGPA